MQTKVQKYRGIWVLLIIGLVMSLSSCTSARFVPKGHYMLKNYVTIKGAKAIDPEPVIRTLPNRRIFLPKTYLHLYNIGTTLARDTSWVKKQFLKNPKRKRTFDQTVNWLRRGIGEPPALIDRETLKRDSVNIMNTYSANGFFDATVRYEVDTIDSWFEGRKAKVTFQIEEKKPFRIRKIVREIKDYDIAYLYTWNQKRSLIKAGDRFTYAALTSERARTTKEMRNSGFFTFSPNLVQFRIDTFLTESLPPPQDFSDPTVIDSVAKIDTLTKWLDVRVEILKKPPKYYIRHIYVDLETASESATQMKNDTLKAPYLTPERRKALHMPQKRFHDTLQMTFTVDPRLLKKINYNFIAQKIKFKEGKVGDVKAIYSQEMARKTQRNLQDLGMFQYVILNFDVYDSLQAIDVFIDMRMAKQYQYKMGMEAYTNDIASSTILPIGGASLSLRNKNTFRRSELFELTLSGNVGLYPVNDTTIKPFWQWQAKANFNFPRFLLPIPDRLLPVAKVIKNNLSRFNPRTNLALSVLQENREEFDRTTFGGNLNYRWQHIPDQEKDVSRLTPMAIDYIDITIEDPDFQKEVDLLAPAVQRGFQSSFNSHMRYSYTHSTYRTNRIEPTIFWRLSYEGGGNVPYLIDWLGGSDGTLSDHSLGDLVYGQYAKLTAEGKLFLPFGKKAELVLRGVMGASSALWNHTVVVPPESRFFSGGTTSMRGWQSNTLGPGTFELEDIQESDATNNVSSLLALGGEYIFEANAELRVDVWSYLEMAAFTDVGNVWFNNRDRVKETLGDTQNRTTLSRGNLYPGWDAGIGFRFDFSFLIVRLDIAQQIFSPDRVYREGGNGGWINYIGGNRLQYNFGIDYPF